MVITITNTLAHRIIQLGNDSGKSLTWKHAMTQASKEINLQAQMKAGIVTFTFQSKKGERTATGTQSLDLIPSQHHPKDRGGNAKTVTFWDLEVEGDFKWRSFSAGTLLNIAS